MENFCYWSDAALVLAERQTVENEVQARRILKRQGCYREPLTGAWYPFPAPEPSDDQISKFPALKNASGDADARLKLLHHRATTYRLILSELHAAGAIEFYESATLLPIEQSAPTAALVVDIDRISAQIIEYSKARASTPTAPAKMHNAQKKRTSLTEAQRVEILRRARAGESQAALAAEFGVSQQSISKTCLREGKKRATSIFPTATTSRFKL